MKDPSLYGQYLVALLECQPQEKVRFYMIPAPVVLKIAVQPSIQKLVHSMATEFYPYISDETIWTNIYSEETPNVKDAVDALKFEFSPAFIDPSIVSLAIQKQQTRETIILEKYETTVRPHLPCIFRSRSLLYRSPSSRK